MSESRSGVEAPQDAHAHDDREDVSILGRLGYRQELRRRMSGFSNFAISLSIICVLAGGITSFHLGFGAAGGAAIGIGWPLSILLSLAFAATMAQVGSAYPTAGGLYHWAAILGGRGWGWITAWLNLLGLITVLAAINVGTYSFALGAVGPALGIDASVWTGAQKFWIQAGALTLITGTQALINHFGIHATARLTDFSGYWIMTVAAALTAALLWFAPSWDFGRLVTLANYTGLPAERPVWPRMESLGWAFAVAFLLPAYTITGFDASAHTSEETLKAAHHVPRGIIRSVLVSGIFGWVMLAAIILAMPSLDEAAAQGDQVFFWTIAKTLPRKLGLALFVAIGVAQYLCGLATVTSASRMMYAFARDGGLPASRWLKRVSAAHGVPAPAIWVTFVLAVGFTLYTPVYSTITVVCVIFLYLSYMIPALLGFRAYQRTWKTMGPWSVGGHFRWLAAVCVAGAVFFVVIGVQPPNDKALVILGASFTLAGVAWFGLERRRFTGPPRPEE